MSASIRMRNKLWFVGLLLCVFGATGWAGQSAKIECVAMGWNNWGGFECTRLELRVAITSDADVGLTGAFGIGVQLASGDMAYWSTTAGFTKSLGRMDTVDGIHSAIPARGEYVIFAGSPAELCAVAGGQTFSVFAGHGVVPAEREAQLQFLASKNLKGISIDHMRAAALQYDVHKNPWKVGLVLTHSPVCE